MERLEAEINEQNGRLVAIEATGRATIEKHVAELQAKRDEKQTLRAEMERIECEGRAALDRAVQEIEKTAEVLKVYDSCKDVLILRTVQLYLSTGFLLFVPLWVLLIISVSSTYYRQGHVRCTLYSTCIRICYCYSSQHVPTCRKRLKNK